MQIDNMPPRKEVLRLGLYSAMGFGTVARPAAPVEEPKERILTYHQCEFGEESIGIFWKTDPVYKHLTIDKIVLELKGSESRLEDSWFKIRLYSKHCTQMQKDCCETCQLQWLIQVGQDGHYRILDNLPPIHRGTLYISEEKPSGEVIEHRYPFLSPRDETELIQIG